MTFDDAKKTLLKENFVIMSVNSINIEFTADEVSILTQAALNGACIVQGLKEKNDKKRKYLIFLSDMNLHKDVKNKLLKIHHELERWVSAADTHRLSCPTIIASESGCKRQQYHTDYKNVEVSY